MGHSMFKVYINEANEIDEEIRGKGKVLCSLNLFEGEMYAIF